MVKLSELLLAIKTVNRPLVRSRKEAREQIDKERHLIEEFAGFITQNRKM